MGQLRKAIAALAVSAILYAPGCGDGGSGPPVSSSKEEVTVKGTVTVKGKPATGGEVNFNPANINRKDAASRTAKIGPDGSYTITTLTGENIVTVHGPEVDADPVLQTNSKSISLKSGETNVPIEVP